MEQKTERFNIGGMNCASCANTIETNLTNSERVKDASVNFASEEAKVTYQGSRDKVIETIEQSGYKVVSSEEENEPINYKKEALKSWIITSPIVILMFLDIFGIGIIPETIANITYLLFSTPVVLYYGRHTHISAYEGLKNNRKFNMDSLITIGTIAAYVTGVMVFITPIANYSGVGAMIMASHLVGTHLENKAKGEANTSIERLLSLRVNEAELVVDGGKNKTVSTDSLEEDDVVLVKPGEKIPLDGVVIEGETSIDESMVTGESKHVTKTEGDEVIGSTINQTGAIKVRITKTGDSTFLSQVIELVKEAQGSKVPIQSLTDKVTNVFVPTVLFLAFFTFIIWFLAPGIMTNITSIFAPYVPWVDLSLEPLTLALFASIAVLVIACPCALGLATPTALMTGTGKAAENGILYKNGEAIQTMTEVDTVILDKTGTITKGEPTVENIIVNQDMDENEFLRILGGVEYRSEHHIATAILNYLDSEEIEPYEPTSFNSFTGKGVKGEINGETIYAGNEKLIKEKEITNTFTEQANDLEDDGKTVIFVGNEEEVIGIVSISDPIKGSSQEAIESLQKDNGLDVWMITGDNERTAEAISNEVGITKVIAEALPQEKLEKTEELQSENKKVAMVGDGINDAPALKKANVGIAIGTGTDIAIESSDVNLVKGELDDLVTSFTLSSKTFNIIKQNLVWAFVYNLIAIPVAIIGLLHPVIAVIAMFASSLSVIGNSLRLK